MPFSVEQFLEVFRSYNQAIWPAQPIAYALGLVALLLAIKGGRAASRLVALILALFWIWNGAAYQMAFFATINRAALLFGPVMIAGGLLFLYAGTLRGKLPFRAGGDGWSMGGYALIAYAMVGYPWLGSYLGHVYPQSPVFGVAPCPTTVFTFGLLLFTGRTLPRYLLAVPLLWSLVGVTAAASLGIREDLGLLAGPLVTVALSLRDRRETSPNRQSAEAH